MMEVLSRASNLPVLQGENPGRFLRSLVDAGRNVEGSVCHYFFAS
jgi:hypothetical protein